MLREAAQALIAQLAGVGIRDPADIARRLNRRGFPCHGRKRWSAGAVRTLQIRSAQDAPSRRDEAA